MTAQCGSANASCKRRTAPTPDDPGRAFGKQNILEAVRLPALPRKPKSSSLCSPRESGGTARRLPRFPTSARYRGMDEGTPLHQRLRQLNRQPNAITRLSREASSTPTQLSPPCNDRPHKADQLSARPAAQTSGTGFLEDGGLRERMTRAAWQLARSNTHKKGTHHERRTLTTTCPAHGRSGLVPRFQVTAEAWGLALQLADLREQSGSRRR